MNAPQIGTYRGIDVAILDRDLAIEALECLFHPSRYDLPIPYEVRDALIRIAKSLGLNPEDYIS
jgi:hypothetical protein